MSKKRLFAYKRGLDKSVPAIDEPEQPQIAYGCSGIY